MDMMLLEEGTPADLVLRGFSRDEVLDATGIDVGYNARSLRSELSGIDRVAYKVAFVREHNGADALSHALGAYADGLDKESVLRMLGIANQNLMKLKALFAVLGLADEFTQADKRHRRGAMQAGMVAAYGVDNPFKLDEFQDSAKQTRKQRYGAEYTMAQGSSLAATARETFAQHMRDDSFRASLAQSKAETCLEHYGVEHPMQSDEIKAKFRGTSLARYGVEHPSQADAVKAKVRETSLARYGVEHPTQSDVMKAKAQATMLERYGVENWSQTPGARAAQAERMRDGSVRARGLATMLERYGVRYSWENDELRAKMHMTVHERYGADHYSQSEDYRRRLPEIQERREQTSHERYGADHYSQSEDYRRRLPEIQERREQTSHERYGADHYSQSEDYRRRLPEIQERREQTSHERYGADHYSQSEDYRRRLPEIQERREQTSHERYGADHYSQSEDYRRRLPEIQERREQTMRDRGSFSASAVEDALAAVSGFERQYRDDARYPHMCDLYDSATDMFVEVNASWIHGGHWFGSATADTDVLSVWQDKALGSDYYGTAADVWSRRDVAKREHARAAGLNYVVLWAADGLDSELWAAMGMPVGRDWEREYSWLPDRIIERDVDVSGMPLSWRMLSAIVKDAQRSVFYEHELDLWDENPMRAGRWGTVRAYLYANRWHYLHKLPDELTDREILRAFRISGMHIGFTSFDSEMMRRVIAGYGIESVYDPCSGWGERMMTCAMLGVGYEGCDINERLQPGYAKLAAKVDGFAPMLHVGDAASQDVRTSPDAIITCPPYMATEVYTDQGAENLCEQDFSVWWAGVVKRCSASCARVFAVQTNQACRQVFLDGLVAAGWRLETELIYARERKGHFHRTGLSEKHEFESMLVMVR